MGEKFLQAFIANCGRGRRQSEPCVAAGFDAMALRMQSTERRASLSSSTTGTGDSGIGSVLGTVFIEQRGIKHFESNHDYLYAMTEDLAEWFNYLYSRTITVDSFFDDLDNGVLLCTHAQEMQNAGSDYFQNQNDSTYFLRVGNKALHLPKTAPKYRSNARGGTFLARDNVCNFINWCKAFGVPECLLFETDDLVERKNPRNVILCLLELARIGAKFGMEVPDLVHLEEEIEAEMELSSDSGIADTAVVVEGTQQRLSAGAKSEGRKPPYVPPGAATATATRPRKERPVCDLRSLDERVRDLVKMCTCEKTFPMKRLAEGKYLFGDNSTLIFVRVLRNHVMVRVGGGWDTLDHLLLKHDTCRVGKCGDDGKETPSAKRSTPIKMTPGSTGSVQLQHQKHSSPVESPLAKRRAHQALQKMDREFQKLDATDRDRTDTSSVTSDSPIVSGRFSRPVSRSRIPAPVAAVIDNTKLPVSNLTRTGSLLDRAKPKPRVAVTRRRSVTALETPVSKFRFR